MLKRAPEAISSSEFCNRLETALAEQRARVFVFVTGKHDELARKSETFSFALSQADHLIASDGFGGGKSVLSQESMFKTLLEWSQSRALKISLLAGPEPAADERVRYLETQFHGFPKVIPINFKENFESDEHVTGKVIEEINRHSPDILFVWSALKSEEEWIANYRHRFNCSVVIGLH